MSKHVDPHTNTFFFFEKRSRLHLHVVSLFGATKRIFVQWNVEIALIIVAFDFCVATNNEFLYRCVYTCVRGSYDCIFCLFEFAGLQPPTALSLALFDSGQSQP